MSETAGQQKNLSIFNTMTRRKEPFEPLVPGKVMMYNCGPTVYNYFHIGNARNFVVADVIRRYLEYRGYRVTFIQNITDIDDKIINRANEEGVTTTQLAEKYTKIFYESSDKLGVRRADKNPRATEYVGKMIELIRKLEEKGFAYAVGSDVYFRVSKFADYGKLSGKKIEDLISGARVEIAEHKENPTDFALWKAAKEGEPWWESPWGKGRPGWHLECSAMSMDLLGESFDIHLGGVDLIFPHHENEIAQSEAATGKPFVRYWMHNGFLNINGEKMSKSLGNFFTIDEILAKFEAPVVRYFLLGAHYRAPLDFSDAALNEAATALNRLREARQTVIRLAQDAPFSPDAPLPEDIDGIRIAFESAMDDDFNTPRALAALFDAVGLINQIAAKAITAEKAGGSLGEGERARLGMINNLLTRLGEGILGFDLTMPEAGLGDISEQLLNLLIDVRNLARKEKQYAIGDRVRNGLAELGFELLDRPSGTEWKKK